MVFAPTAGTDYYKSWGKLVPDAVASRDVTKKESGNLIAGCSIGYVCSNVWHMPMAYNEAGLPTIAM